VSKRSHLAVLGERVAELRRGRRLSQAELAERARVTAKYVSEVERGVANPSLDVLRALARPLGVTLARLLAERGEVDAEIAALLGGRPATDRRRAVLVLRALFAPLDDE